MPSGPYAQCSGNDGLRQTGCRQVPQARNCGRPHRRASPGSVQHTTRRYLDAVLAALESLPDDVAQERLVTLSGDRSFSPKWRKKFQAVLWDVDADEEPYDPCW